MAPTKTVANRITPKNHFLVFCTIFLTLVVLLGLGAWHTRAEIERQSTAEQNDDRSPEFEAPPASSHRFANPPPSTSSSRSAPTEGR